MGPMGDFPDGTQYTWYKIVDQGSCPKNNKQEPYRFWSESLVLPGADEAQRYLWRIRDSQLAMEIIVARKLNTTSVVYVEYGAKIVGTGVAPSPYGMNLASALLVKLENDMPGKK